MTGLRNGTPITLTSSAPTDRNRSADHRDNNHQSTNRKEGHGNVLISLALAKQQLGERPSTVLVMASVKANNGLISRPTEWT